MPGADRREEQDEAQRALPQIESYLREAEHQLARAPDPATAALVRAVRELAALTRLFAAR
jgi:Tfp pilus assembly protein PilX